MLTKIHEETNDCELCEKNIKQEDRHDTFVRR